MAGTETVALAYLAVFLVLGLVALLRAPKADIPAVLQALARWLRR